MALLARQGLSRQFPHSWANFKRLFLQTTYLLYFWKWCTPPHRPTSSQIFKPKRKLGTSIIHILRNYTSYLLKGCFKEIKDFYFRPSIPLFISSSIRTTHNFGAFSFRIIAEPLREKYTFIVETSPAFVHYASPPFPLSVAAFSNLKTEN